MKIAIIGDVHSNITALERVLEDIEARNVDYVFGTGDLVGYLPYPNEVIDLFRKHHILCVQGNHDYVMGNQEVISLDSLQSLSLEELQANASRCYTNYVITDLNRTYLREMPTVLHLTLNHKKLIIVHGSPSSQNEYLYDKVEILGTLAEEMKEDILISGHTHIPYVRTVNDKVFINSGSVGKPKHGNGNATYILLSIEEEVTGEIIEVDYDKTNLINAINKERMISDSLIDMINNGF